MTRDTGILPTASDGTAQGGGLNEQKPIFTVTDFQGDEIVLTEEDWERITSATSVQGRPGRPAITGGRGRDDTAPMLQRMLVALQLEVARAWRPQYEHLPAPRELQPVPRTAPAPARSRGLGRRRRVAA